MRIRDLSAQERPRERLRDHGVSTLTDAELLAVLLGTGTRGQSAIEVGRTLAARGLRRLARLRLAELAATPGVGTAKAARVLASMELARRAARAGSGARITGERAAIRHCRDRIGHLTQEHVLVLWLGARHHIIGQEIITRGLVDEALLHPREVFRGAIAAGASAVIVAHNHPSGDTRPSAADREAARVLSAAGDLLGIPVLDQLIVNARGGRSVSRP